jgi:hypothetical protein
VAYRRRGILALATVAAIAYNSLGSANADRVMDVADMARLAVERTELDVLERGMRAVGARRLLERQPNPDGTLCRVGAAGLRD